jgi:hypothetical protein
LSAPSSRHSPKSSRKTVSTGNEGGGIYNASGGQVAIQGGSTLSNNSAFSFGGAIANASGGQVTLQGSTLSGNSATWILGGGGAILNAGTLSINGSTVSGNTAPKYGGAIYNTGSIATISGSTLANNNARYGGAIDNTGAGTVSITGSTLSGDTSSASTAKGGGGIFTTSSAANALTVTGCTLSGNTAAFEGGALMTYNSIANVSNSTFSNNTARYGGGIGDFNSILTISGSTFTGNAASGSGAIGGGLFDKGNLTVVNSTFAGNKANSGGGLFIQSGTLTNVTVANNEAGAAALGNGGGIDQAGGFFPTLKNTLVAGNFNVAGGGFFQDDDVSGTLAGQNNLISDGTGMTGLTNGTNGNQIGNVAGNPYVIDPLLTALGNYGGPTQTMALLPGSPARAAGTTSGITATTDQRGPGFARIVAGTIDIGAFQTQGFVFQKLGGDNQVTQINTAFVQPLQVRVLAIDGIDPVGGGMVTFTSPGLYPARNVATIVGDRASLTVTANTFGSPTPYNVVVSAAGGDLVPPPFKLTVVAPGFSDPFTRPSGSAGSLGNFWAEVANVNNTINPEFTISSNAAMPHNSGANTLNAAIVNDFTPADVSVSAQVSINTIASLSYGGVMARLNNGNTEAYVGVLANALGQHRAFLGLLQGTAIHFFANVSLGSTTSGLLTLDVFGSSLRLFLGSTLLASATDTTLTAAGGVGIVDENAVSTFTNFSATAGLSFTDTFQRLGSPTVGPGWSPDLGVWSNNGVQMMSNGSGLNVLSVIGVNRSSVDVQATIGTIGTSAGVVADWNSATQSGYELLLTPTQVQLVKVVNGVAGSPLVTQAVNPLGSNNVLELQANGSTLTACLNGQFLFTFTDNSSPFTSGSVGLAASGNASAFSSFSVTGP